MNSPLSDNDSDLSLFDVEILGSAKWCSFSNNKAGYIMNCLSDDKRLEYDHYLHEKKTQIPANVVGAIGASNTLKLRVGAFSPKLGAESK